MSKLLQLFVSLTVCTAKMPSTLVSKFYEFGEVMNHPICGHNRYKNRYLIRAYLLQRGLNMRQLALTLGISAETVSATILGKKHSPQVLDALKNLGVPERYLFDPRHDSHGA